MIKLGDIMTVKGLISQLPVGLKDILLAIFFTATITLLYTGGRNKYNKFVDKQNKSAVHDSLILRGQVAILGEVRRMNARIDSVSRRQMLQDKKMNLVADELARVSHGTTTILYEFRRIDEFYQMFNRPISYTDPAPEKKKLIP